MGIYVDAEIRYGMVIPEDADREQAEAQVEDVDGLEVTYFGDYEWYDGDQPQYALVLTVPKVRCSEYAVKKFGPEELSVPALPGGMDEAQEVAKQTAAGLWGGDWAADADYLLVWSRG